MPDRQNLLPDEKLHDLLDEIPSAPSVSRKKTTKRNRTYERMHRTFSYRLTDKQLAEDIAAIAEDLLVPVDDVARAFVEVGLKAAQNGEIPLERVPLVPRRMTLYPTDKERWEIREETGWPREIPTRKRKRKLSEVERKLRQKARNEYRVSYRWTASIDAALTELVDDHFGSSIRSEGRKGLVLTILLRYGLAAYRAGRLPLKAEIRTANQRLKW
jgi:hypothetical protein